MMIWLSAALERKVCLKARQEKNIQVRILLIGAAMWRIVLVDGSLRERDAATYDVRQTMPGPRARR